MNRVLMLLSVLFVGGFCRAEYLQWQVSPADIAGSTHLSGLNLDNSRDFAVVRYGNMNTDYASWNIAQVMDYEHLDKETHDATDFYNGSKFELDYMSGGNDDSSSWIKGISF